MDAISQFLGTAEVVDYSRPLATVNEQRKDIISKVDNLRDNNSVDDYEFVRQNLRSIIVDGMELVPDAISLARASEKSNFIESVSALLSTMAQINKDLLEINKIDAKGRSAAQDAQINNTTNNTAIICSSEDMLRRISQTLSEE